MQYDLVFEGGGAKGIVFVGACEEFVKRGHTYGRLLGTSAGAITAALLAAGYTPQEMLQALNERENGKPIFAGFMGVPGTFTLEEIRSGAIRELLRDINIKILPDFLENKVDDILAQTLAAKPRFRHFVAFVERGGWYAADLFVSWLQTKLDSGFYKSKKRNFSELSLSQFFAATETDLSLVASDTTDGRILVLNQNTSPDCPLVWAVRMSMSIPFLWNEVIWADHWGKYQGDDINGHAIVDGGLLSNFPIELFISDQPQVTKLMGPKQQNPILGLLIDESLPVPQISAKGLVFDVDVKIGELQTIRRISRLVNTVTTAHDKMVIEEFSHLVVRLPAAGYGTTEFDMSDERRTALVDAGRKAMRAYFDNPPSIPGVSKGLDPLDAGKRSADRIATKLLMR